jgi:hypothetical protein
MKLLVKTRAFRNLKYLPGKMTQLVKNNINLSSPQVDRSSDSKRSSASSADQDTITSNKINKESGHEDDSTFIRATVSAETPSNHSLIKVTSKDNFGNQTSTSFQSASDTLPREESALYKQSNDDLSTQEQEGSGHRLAPITYQSYSSISDMEFHPTNVPIGLTASILLRIHQLSQRMWQLVQQYNRGEEIIDLERQPLIPVDPGEHDHDGSLEARYVPYIGSYPPLIITTVVVAIIVVVVFLVTKDVSLLIKVLHAILCYLFGAGLSEKVFWSEFCPTFNK